MESVKNIIIGIFNLLNIPISIYGYTFTIWQIIILFAITSAAAVLISYLLGGGE